MLSNEEFNRIYAVNGIQADLDNLGRKYGTAGSSGGIHGDVTPDGEFLPHTKGNPSVDPPV